MSENETLEMLRSLQNKVKRLIEEYQVLVERIKVLETINADLLEKNQKYQKSFDQMNNELKIQNLTELLTQGKGKTEVKALIDRMVREIDKCIGLINQPDLKE
jgi:sugar-specific transcriptional regulator TrmB